MHTSSMHFKAKEHWRACTSKSACTLGQANNQDLVEVVGSLLLAPSKTGPNRYGISFKIQGSAANCVVRRQVSGSTPPSDHAAPVQGHLY
eukprot:1160636-Pelagomonas_calceolata.AAC.12